MSTRRNAKLPRQRFDKTLGGWICRNCGKVVPKGRRSWCNKACEQEAGIKAWPSMARALVFKRDHGICAKCGFDAGSLDEAVKALQPRARYASGGIVWERPKYSPTYRDFLRATGLRLNRSHWEAHHKHAVAEGGGECGLDGYETLCWRCHPKETGKLRKRLNQQKRATQKLPLFATKM